MAKRLVHALGWTILASIASAILLALGFQWWTGIWSLQNAIDVAGGLGVASTLTATVICTVTFLPVDLLIGRLRLRSAVALGLLLSASVGLAALSRVFLDDPQHRGIADWAGLLASPLLLPFVTTGAAFGYGWSHPPKAD
jgi:hypothetical protein